MRISDWSSDVCSADLHQIRRIAEILDAPNSDLPDLMREECRDLLEQIAEKTGRINARTAKIKALAAEADTARRLQTIPGVGPLTALAVEAFAPPMESFRCGRDFAAWLGLVPRQFSSGDRKSTRLNSSHSCASRMPTSA